jgi:hypothetical protein
MTSVANYNDGKDTLIYPNIYKYDYLKIVLLSVKYIEYLRRNKFI